MKKCIKCKKEFQEKEMVDMMEDVAGSLVYNWVCLICAKEEDFLDWYDDNGFGSYYGLDDL
jgi:DNA-directed RNA polymerase subunit RPC12/RpoP